jgi:uncharacterized Zn finger protein
MLCPKCNFEIEIEINITENGLNIITMQCPACGYVYKPKKKTKEKQ